MNENDKARQSSEGRRREEVMTEMRSGVFSNNLAFCTKGLSTELLRKNLDSGNRSIARISYRINQEYLPS